LIMITEKGILPIGIEYNGKTHTDYEIREQLVSDMIDVFDNPDQVERAGKNNYYLGLCITANMIINIGTIPKEAITSELLLGMYQDDLSELKKAEVRLDDKRKSFRREEKNTPQDSAGTTENGL
jgi:hypothetical protein